MPLSTGQILNNRYRIVKLLGQGGFGAVYRAWDINLDRPCAVKENLDASPPAQQQFQREARILADLNHPNLARVIDYFFIPGQGQYFVMDFVEGQDLQQMLDLAGGPLPEAQVLGWIRQVCDALAYLHSQNPPVIHRDVKPANIKITPEGRAMLVDFGIAKVYDPNLKTTAGARAVTAGYSPPEQYGSGKTDARSDIYALGASLYTLLSGQAPVESVERSAGKTLLAPSSLNSSISPYTEKAILQAMDLNPAQRQHTASELKASLGSPPLVSPPLVAAQLYNTTAVQSPKRASPALPRIGLLLGGGLVVVLALILIGRQIGGKQAVAPTASRRPRLSTETPLPGGLPGPSQAVEASVPIKVSLTPPPEATSSSLPPSQTLLASPTRYGGPGARMAYSSLVGGNREIYLMNADGSDPINLTHNRANDWEPAWCLDGSRIAFASLRDRNWEIYLMNPDGSEQTNLTNVPADDQLPTWSPDKHWIAFQSDRGGNSEIFIIRPDGSQATNLTNHPANDGFPAWSPDGQWIAFQSDRDGHFEIYVIRPDGSQQNRLTSHTSGNLTPAWSPDGTRIAFASFRDDNPEIYTLNFADAMHAPESVSPLRLTNNPAHDLKPAWSPDGKQIAFQSDRSGSFQIYVVNPDGSGPLIRLTNSSENQYPAWQP